MTFLNFLYTFLLMPLQILFEFVYNLAYRITENPGLSIIFLSLAINLLVLPLYRRADAMQEEEREIEAKLHDGVTHIKKAFRGDEKTMMLQTYYRQNHYSPTRVFRGSVSLLLQIPFFIAAYQFLSKLQLLQGVPFGPIADLSQPDALISVAGISINLLPILMTAINVVSTILFTKGQPLKSKIQLYALAAFFLIFLYNSPAGLVFYWTLNNLFSLVKTIFYKLNDPGKVIKTLLLPVGGLFILFGILSFQSNGFIKRLVFFVLLGLALCLPWLYSKIKDKIDLPKCHLLSETSQNQTLFILAGLFLSVLMGMLIPSAVIKASPQEFIDVSYFVHPLWYIVSAFLLAAGTFVLWMGIFYFLGNAKTKVAFEFFMFAFCGIALADYFFFGKNLGILSSDLKYENELAFSSSQIIINILVVGCIFFALYLVYKKWHDKLPRILSIVLIALCCMSVYNIYGICTSVAQVNQSGKTLSDDTPHFTLSQTGKNVVVIMLDRAMGEYIPYLFNEKPELQEKFSGFTYYSNVISYGPFTNFGTPALYGGYEYTPIEMNTRDSESLKSKQNEALKVMPVIFDQAGYDVTVCDPTYANYQWIPDLSIYDDYPDIHAYNTNGYFSSSESKAERVEKRKRNFFCFALTKTMPLFAQSTLYNKGLYNDGNLDQQNHGMQVITSNTTATGINEVYMNAYNVMENLKNMTQIANNAEGGFFMMSNDSTHDTALLQEPAYVPAEIVDNTDYEKDHASRFTLNGKTLSFDGVGQYAHYQCNMAAMLQLATWFDYLRENGVYDNTRIILVSDHAAGLGQIKELIQDQFFEPEFVENEQPQYYDMEFYFPLLMVKDYYSDGFNECSDFMTNADVPTLATQNLIENAENPTTGNTITNSAKEGPQYILASHLWDIELNNGNTYLPDTWYSIHDSIWNKHNWSLVTKNAVLTKKDIGQ